MDNKVKSFIADLKNQKYGEHYRAVGPFCFKHNITIQDILKLANFDTVYSVTFMECNYDGREGTVENFRNKAGAEALLSKLKDVENRTRDSYKTNREEFSLWCNHMKLPNPAFGKKMKQLQREYSALLGWEVDRLEMIYGFHFDIKEINF